MTNKKNKGNKYLDTVQITHIIDQFLVFIIQLKQFKILKVIMCCFKIRDKLKLGGYK